MNLLQIRFISEPSCVTPCSLVAVSMPWTPSSLGCLDELFPKKQHNSFSLKTNFYQMNGESFFSLSPPRRFLPFLQRDLLSSGSRKMELDQCPYFLLGNWSPSSIALGWRAVYACKCLCQKIFQTVAIISDDSILQVLNQK